MIDYNIVLSRPLPSFFSLIRWKSCSWLVLAHAWGLVFSLDRCSTSEQRLLKVRRNTLVFERPTTPWPMTYPIFFPLRRGYRVSCLLCVSSSLLYVHELGSFAYIFGRTWDLSTWILPWRISRCKLRLCGYVCIFTVFVDIGSHFSIGFMVVGWIITPMCRHLVFSIVNVVVYEYCRTSIWYVKTFSFSHLLSSLSSVSSFHHSHSPLLMCVAMMVSVLVPDPMTGQSAGSGLLSVNPYPMLLLTSPLHP